MTGALAAFKGRVLITGGAGYIGSHTAFACLDAGLSVVVLDDLSTGSRALVPEQAIFVEGAVQDEARVRALIHDSAIGAVMHFAASTSITESIANPSKYHSNNTVNSVCLMNAVARSGGLPFILSSTAAVYAPRPGGRLCEQAATGPTSPYGLSKLRTERILAEMARSLASPFLVLRYFNVAGADPLARTGPSARGAGHLLKAASETAIGLRANLPIHGRGHATADGSCVRDYIHVSDLARAHVHALAYLLGGGASGVMNCGSGRGASVLDVVAAFEARIGRRLPTIDAPPRDADAPYVVADDTRLRQVLPGWAPQHGGLDAIVATALAWERRLLARHGLGVAQQA